MTGYGRGESSKNGITCMVEVRSVNSRFLEVVARMPRSLASRENELKEIVRSFVSRGKISLGIVVQQETEKDVPLSINAAAARSYYKLLEQLRKAVRIREPIKLEHLLKFSEVLEAAESLEPDEAEWEAVQEALKAGLKELNAMRIKEGKELGGDLQARVAWMDEAVGRIEALSKARIPEERKRLEERVGQLLGDRNIIDQNRLELEIILLADKLDVTEECVRYRSHSKFFLEAMNNSESSGRKLNFLIQEMNREANTIGSKSNDAEISHLVVKIKEELEKIREQLQNIE